MIKKVATRLLAISSIAISLAVVSIGAFTLSWFMGPNIESDDNFLNGQVGLRNYFYQGDGTEEKPYEIVQPVHLYNLSRLQNLGVFPEKTYFKVGSLFEIEGENVIRCINHIDDQGNPIYEDFLDMGDFSSRFDIHSVGGEFAPFVSEIDGNGVPIRNLKIIGNPEDVGVFGYVAHNGKLENLVFDNLEVTSLGYHNEHDKNDYLLFSQNIEDIFHSADYLATDVSLTFYDHNSTTEDYDAINLKKLNGSSGTQLVFINSDDNVISGTKLFDGYFKPTFPNIENDPFTYSIVSSSALIKPVGDLALEGSDPDDMIFDLEPLYESSDFNKGDDVQVNAKLYLVASTKVDGISFSRVVQSYTIEIYSNRSRYEDGMYSAAIFCDYVDQGDATDKNTGYHHGVNVGLIAGHVDGSIDDCYIYNGKLNFNETNYHPVYSETDTALIGEVGKNVNNLLDPDIGLVIKGDIGIMNFSKIYGLIRTDATPGTVNAGQKIPEGESAFVNYISYKNFINTSTIDMFSDYLRYYDGLKEDYEFLAKTGTNVGNDVWHSYNIPSNVPVDMNNVDFLWNKVIEDEENVDRGLGVFKIVSSYNAAAKANPDRYGQYMMSNFGSCRIVNEASNPKEKVIFTTAEFDHTKGDSWESTWGSSLEDIPKRANTLPSYSDVLSFEYPFSRDFNYCFELDLTKIDEAHGNDYMYNTDSPFLTNYLSSKLIDKYGDPVKPGSARFGFMFRSSENEFLPALTSYMPVGKPGNKQAFESEGTTKYYPSNSIVFSIKNDNGANISVVGNKDDITVYSFDPDSPDQDVTALYTMHSKNIGTSAESPIDEGRYFTYDVKTGETGTTAVEYGGSLRESNAAYGHIFKLKKGDYILGARKDTANIYFLAVQGQTDGTIGAKEIVSLDDKIENVDFLLTPPTLDDFPGSLDRALFYYKGVFNNTSGSVIQDVYIEDNKKYMRITFNNTSAFVVSMHLKSRKSEHIFMFNGVLYDEETHDYVA